MPLLTYSQVRPWAKAIRDAVATRRMPPWFADAAIGHFRNDPSLTAQERETILTWAASGAPEGNPKHASAPIQFVEGWSIGNPDRVFEFPADYQVPVEGTIEYQ